MSLLGLLNQTCTIRSKATAVDANGIKTATWSDAYTGVRCTVQANNTSQDNTAGRETGKATHTAFLPYGTSINYYDRVVPNDGPFATVVFEAIGPGVDDAGRQTYIRVPLLLVLREGTR